MIPLLALMVYNLELAQVYIARDKRIKDSLQWL